MHLVSLILLDFVILNKNINFVGFVRFLFKNLREK